MRLVLATPPFNLLQEGYGTKGRIARGHLQPLGVGYLAGAAVKENIETFIVDSSVLGLNVDEAVSSILKHKPDVIGISVLTAAKDRAFALSDALKKRSETPIIIGGPHATCFPEDIMASLRSVDYLVMGEGEGVIVPLLRCIKEKKIPHNLKGVMFRDGDAIVNNGLPDIERDLDRIVPPARHLYENNLYSPLPHARRRLPATSMMTSRGCTYSKCTFCFSSGRMKQAYRRHSPERVIDEIKYSVKHFGIKEIIFCDDNFLFNRKWVFKFCELVLKNNIDISWSCTARADTVDFDMLRAAKSAGCWTVFYGIESATQPILDKIKKGITLEQVKNAIKWTHKAGLETRGSFIFGLPTEKPEDAKKGIELAISLDLDYALFHAAFPEPGTELYDMALNYGRFETYRGMNKATFIPEGYNNGKEIEDMVSMGYRKFYLRPSYILKRIFSVRSFSDLLRYAEGFLFIKGL